MKAILTYVRLPCLPLDWQQQCGPNGCGHAITRRVAGDRSQPPSSEQYKRAVNQALVAQILMKFLCIGGVLLLHPGDMRASMKVTAPDLCGHEV